MRHRLLLVATALAVTLTCAAQGKPPAPTVPGAQVRPVLTVNDLRRFLETGILPGPTKLAVGKTEFGHFDPSPQWTPAQWEFFIENGTLPPGTKANIPTNFISQQQALGYQEKVNEWEKWADTNVPLYNNAIRENADLSNEVRSLRNDEALDFFFGMGEVIALCAAAIFVWWRFTPKTKRGKQATVLIVSALWTSGCFIAQIDKENTAYHPINAIAMALLFAAPAIVFGAIGFWWYWPWERPGKVERLW
jgi:hypothetical protein